MLEYVFVAGNPEANFWEQNPEIRLFPFAKKIIDEYGEDKAGDIMWSLYLVEDPKSKLYFGMSLSERISVAETRYNINYEDDIINYREKYIEAAMGPHERTFKKLYDKFQKMVSSIENKDLDESIEFFSKIQAMQKGMDLFETKYATELEEAKKKYRGDKKPGGLFKKRT